jgi:hypothetical protein
MPNSCQGWPDRNCFDGLNDPLTLSSRRWLIHRINSAQRGKLVNHFLQPPFRFVLVTFDEREIDRRQHRRSGDDRHNNMFKRHC